MKDLIQEKKTKVINSDVYCAKCGVFLGMTCDPFRDAYHEECYPETPKEELITKVK